MSLSEQHLHTDDNVIKQEAKSQQDIIDALHLIKQILLQFCDTTDKNNESFKQRTGCTIETMIKKITADPFVRIVSVNDLYQYGLPRENPWIKVQLLEYLWDNQESSPIENNHFDHKTSNKGIEKKIFNDTSASINTDQIDMKNNESAKKMYNNTILKNISITQLEYTPVYKWKQKTPYVSLMGIKLIHSMLELTAFKWDIRLARRNIEGMMTKLGYSNYNISSMLRSSNKTFQENYIQIHTNSSNAKQEAFEIHGEKIYFSIKWKTEAIRNWFLKTFVDMVNNNMHDISSLINTKRSISEIKHYVPIKKKAKTVDQLAHHKDVQGVIDKLSSIYDKSESILKEISNIKDEIDSILSS